MIFAISSHLNGLNYVRAYKDLPSQSSYSSFDLEKYLQCFVLDGSLVRISKCYKTIGVTCWQYFDTTFFLFADIVILVNFGAIFGVSTKEEMNLSSIFGILTNTAYLSLSSGPIPRAASHTGQDLISSSSIFFMIHSRQTLLILKYGHKRNSTHRQAIFILRFGRKKCFAIDKSKQYYE